MVTLLMVQKLLVQIGDPQLSIRDLCLKDELPSERMISKGFKEGDTTEFTFICEVSLGRITYRKLKKVGQCQ